MQPEQGVSFGPYRLRGPQGPLFYRSQSVTLPPKALAVLWHLATHVGQVVSKDDLLTTVWEDAVVSEGVLTSCLLTLRKALREDARTPRYIETVHRVGYRFIEKVVSSQQSVVSSQEQSGVRGPASEVNNSYSALHNPQLTWLAATPNSHTFTNCLRRRCVANGNSCSSRARRGLGRRLSSRLLSRV